MNDELRPNFGLSDDDDRRCAVCKKVAFDANEAAHCMAGNPGAAATEGQRVNQNFVCDAFEG